MESVNQQQARYKDEAKIQYESPLLAKEDSVDSAEISSPECSIKVPMEKIDLPMYNDKIELKFEVEDQFPTNTRNHYNF